MWQHAVQDVEDVYIFYRVLQRSNGTFSNGCVYDNVVIIVCSHKQTVGHSPHICMSLGSDNICETSKSSVLVVRFGIVDTEK